MIVGFRADGAASVFFADDPVVHFNAAGELRRGYADGRLLKAEKGRLVSLNRIRTPNETQLVRHELTEGETADYLADVQRRIDALREALDRGQFRVLRQVPEHEELLAAVRVWLAAFGHFLVIAASPRAAAKK